MLHTPPQFTPLLTDQDHPDPHTLVFHCGRVLVAEADGAFASEAVVAGLDLPPAQRHPVGLLGARLVRSAWTGREDTPAGHRWASLRSLLGTADDGLLGVAGRAAQIAEWARTHRFCGACATATVAVAGERCLRCPACGHAAYPRISPAMIVLVRKGDTVLLARHTQSPYPRFSPLAGFLEAGESAEEAVHREVREEVGIRVHNLRYFGSQSWPFPHSLMIAFTADWLAGELQPDPGEIAEARWFGPGDDWPDTAPGFSISSALVEAHRRA